MKRNLTLLMKRAFAGLVVLTAAASQAQTQFPGFTNATPDGNYISLYRSAPIVGDYNNDGVLETLVIGRNTVGWAVESYILRQGENGLEKTAGWHESLGLPENKIYNPTLAWIDYNNDGWLDLLVMGSTTDDDKNSDKKANLLFNLYWNNEGEFQLVENTGLEGAYIEQENMYGSAVAVGDYDGDGYQDVMITGKVGGSNKVWLYKNNAGDGTFQKNESFENLNNGSISFGDYNNDGLLDILYNGWGENGKVKLYKNVGEGQFEDMNIDVVVAEGTQKGRVMWADFNADGYLDFIVTGERQGSGSWTKHADLYINDKQGSFTKAEFQEGKALTAVSYGSVDVADFNADGKLDLVVVGTDGKESSAIYLNMGTDENGKFAFEKQANTFGLLRSGAVVVAADYDNDGYLDVFSMGYGTELQGGKSSASLFVWHNDGDLTKNEAPTAPTDLKASYADGAWTFSWKAGSDKETPEEALAYNLYVKKSNGELVTVIPADVETGFLKVSELTPAIRTLSYTLPLPNENMEWGVQTIDQGKLGSAFATATTSTPTTGYKETDNVRASVYAENGVIHIESEEPARVSLYTLSGKQVAGWEGVESLNAPLEKGVYLVQLETNSGRKVSKVVL